MKKIATHKMWLTILTVFIVSLPCLAYGDDDNVSLTLRSQRLIEDVPGEEQWIVAERIEKVPPCQIAIIICDMWDTHSSVGAAARVARLAPIVNDRIKQARNRGMHIIHAPSGTMDYYKDHKAYQRGLKIKLMPLPVKTDSEGYVGRQISERDLPIDASSDTDLIDHFRPGDKPWTRQHPAIEIDEDRDIITTSLPIIYSYFWQQGITHVVFMGVHSNVCVLMQSFGILAIQACGLKTTLCRDLTDAYYGPKGRPYVSHEDGNQLMIGYIEKFVCPTIDSQDLLVDVHLPEVDDLLQRFMIVNQGNISNRLSTKYFKFFTPYRRTPVPYII
jgi:nicotinamidase-related amidase